MKYNYYLLLVIWRMKLYNRNSTTTPLAWKFRKSAPLFQPDQLIDFPHRNEQELKLRFIGSYQLSQAASYLAEILENNNQPTLFYVRENSNIVGIDVISRHINRKLYHVHIESIPKWQQLRKYF